MTTGFVKEQNLEKQIERQMGCMAGFLQIFDRHQFLTGKRFYSAKRLPPPVVDTTSSSEKSAPQSPPKNSSDFIKPLLNPKQTPAEFRSNPAVAPPPKPPLPQPIFELKEGTKSSWKFCKEAPRLSLDSRATTDAKGGLHPKEIRTTTSGAAASKGDDSTATGAATDGDHQHRSPSVIARLMGLDPYPNSSEPEKKPELRRSASESRVSKDLFQSRFVADGNNFSSKQPIQSHSVDTAPKDAHFSDPRNHSIRKAAEGLNKGCINSTSPWRAPPHRKNFFDSGDIFPEPKQSVSIYGEIEKRIKVRGIDDTSKDLETLKQILEALQLKGLLHPKQPSQPNDVRHRNFVYDDSPIVLMKPSRSNGNNQVGGVRRNYSLAGEKSPSVSPMRERNVRSPTRGGRGPITGSSEGNADQSHRSKSPVKPRQLSVETQRRVNDAAESRSKASPVHSPKLSTRRDPTASSQSPRSKKPTSQIRQKERITNVVVVAEDESSSISGSSVTTSTDTERSKGGGDEQREGRNILARCDKLLHSIAEMAAADMQPSPVSVLDYKDDSFSPSPVASKRNIDFKDNESIELEEETWSPIISPIRAKWVETSRNDSDFAYISEILRAASSHHLQEKCDVFLLLEKQQFLKGNSTSKDSTLKRKLIFDTVNEITDRDRRLPPWKCVSVSSLDKVWSEYQSIRVPESGEDLFETICGVLKRDLAINGWGDCPVENSEAVLDIERLIFKDLIGELIGDLVDTLSLAMPRRRKLVF